MAETIVTCIAICSKCGKELEIPAGHIGKKHKSCGGRKQDGSSKINCGIWIMKPIPKTEEEKEK